ncbi:helix-turn-helix domain-containing protein, partial [Mycolicibacillus trivialis]|uniref:helix-turn-helix domain-containing protein n=1 Tax=Mycolicibacillus trivialis TaxID=1798 RepID=UPI001F1CD8EE
MSHANARTNVFARRLIVERVAGGWPPAQVAQQLGISRATVYKWLRRYAEGGDAALVSVPVESCAVSSGRIVSRCVYGVESV